RRPFGSVSASWPPSAAAPVFFLPRPPRLPRRRFGLLGSVVSAAGSADDSITSGSDGASSAAGSAAAASDSARFRRRNQGKKKLLRSCARQRRPLQRGDARAAGQQ